jgi:HAE1 family hydrophobic/amphiphilic exporter-1
MWLTRLALRNPIFILMLSLMALVLGLVSLNRLGVDLFPNIDIPVVRIATFYPGAGPEDIEKAITLPIERAGEAPVGLMLVGRHGEDRALLGLALGIEAALAASRA